MKPSGVGDTAAGVNLCRLEFFTLHRGCLVRKVEAEREWMEAQGRACGPVCRTWADERLLSLHREFAAAMRRPMWFSFHPELAPALVGDIAGGRRVVIQLREHFEAEKFFPLFVSAPEISDHRFNQ